MSILKTFKPNLIPNNPKDGSVDLDKIIQKNGGYNQYLITRKKDGCRLHLIESKVLTRALKEPGSKLVIERFQELANELHKIGVAVDGEFYMHGLKFNAIFRFFSKSDVECFKYKKELEKAFDKSPGKFLNEYDNLSIEFLTKFHSNLKLHIFDGIILDRPEIKKYSNRIAEIQSRLKMIPKHLMQYVEIAKFDYPHSKEELENLYEDALEDGYEGLVLTHRDHEYKFGRNSLNQGTLLKMKDDALEYDGIVLDVLEATSIKEGIERTTNELGRSVTSKKKDDREDSGLAKGFLVQFRNLGTFTVGLKGFSNEMKRDLLKNKVSDYIGRHFKYKAMAPVKDFPRHAYFDCWRDEK